MAWDSEAGCGYISKLPTIEPADDVDHGATGRTHQGGNWINDQTQKHFEIHDLTFLFISDLQFIISHFSFIKKNLSITK